MIGFMEEVARCLHHPHNNALMVSIQVRDYNTHRVLIDNGSFVDILYYPTFQQMRIDRDRLVLANTPLVGFRGTRVYPLGTVTLLIMVGDYPQQTTKDVTFLMVDYSSAYNAIIGHPTLNSWKAMISTYHLMIKFPTKYKIGEVQGDQITARECYIAMLKMDNHLQTMCIEEQRTMVEPVKGLEKVLLDDSRLKRMARISILASLLTRQTLTIFLKENQDVFAWSHDDMPRIDPLVIVHRLNVSPFFPPIR